MKTSQVFSRIDSVVLRVHHREAAVDWYLARLGFRILCEDAAAGVTVLDMGRGDTLTLWQLRGNEIAVIRNMSGTFPVFEATDAVAQRAELIARGVEASQVREVSRLKSFSFWDLDGNRLEACEVVGLDETMNRNRRTR